jgi:hypothetical protein
MNISTNYKRKGIALIWVMLLFIVMIGIAGLLIDWARYYLTAQKLHNTADAAALAGSRYVAVSTHPDYTGITAETIAQNFADKHTAANLPVELNPTRYALVDTVISSIDPDEISPYDIPDDIVIGRYVDWNQTFIVDHTTPDSMLVVARREGAAAPPANQPKLPLLFGPIFGVNTVNVKRYAIAKVKNPFGAGLLALGECPIFPGDPGCLTVFGGGSLYINSSYINEGGNDGAVDQSGNAHVDVDIDRMYVVGSVDDNFDYPEGADIQDYTNSVEPEPDPYEYLPDHDLTAIRAMEDKGTIADSNDPQTYTEGYYSGGIQISGSEVTLMPGDYYLDSVGYSQSMKVNGGLITGEGVTLHIIGDADFGIDVGGNANIDISAPTSTSNPYAGVAIYQKRDPTYDCFKSCKSPWQQSFPLSEFNGGGVVIIDGGVYMPHNKLELGGTGDIYVGRTVADRFYIYGDGKKEVHYKGIPDIAPKSYLVE